VKEIVIISGKGGTGKTTVAAAFAALAKHKVMADCDVDAADLHLILQPDIRREEDFYAGKTAFIRKSDCTECGKCTEVCQFDAIRPGYIVGPISCEGCGVCVWFCPARAIDFNDNCAGQWFISRTRFGPLIHARLGIAEENSGKLVALVRREARHLAETENLDYIIIDGAPGLGCPVISSISGATAVLIVTEPTLSGLHDLERVVRLSAEHFSIPTHVCVNKFDLNEDMTARIERICADMKVHFTGKIPYDTAVTEAMVQGKSIVEYTDGDVSKEIIGMWNKIRLAI